MSDCKTLEERIRARAIKANNERLAALTQAVYGELAGAGWPTIAVEDDAIPAHKALERIRVAIQAGQQKAVGDRAVADFLARVEGLGAEVEELRDSVVGGR